MSEKLVEILGEILGETLCETLCEILADIVIVVGEEITETARIIVNDHPQTFIMGKNKKFLP